MKFSDLFKDDNNINEKGGKYFKACIVGKIESTKQHIENPQGYADELYNEIKNKCS